MIKLYITIFLRSLRDLFAAAQDKISGLLFIPSNKTLVRNWILSVCFLATILQTACKNNESNGSKNQEEEEIVQDSLQTAKGIISEDSAMIFKNEGPLWLGNSLKEERLDWKKFQLTEFWTIDSLRQTRFEESAEFYKDYASVLKWSPDSSFVLDIGSYGSVLVKDKNGKMQVKGGEPDTEVSIIYPKKHTRERLMFMGPSSQIINAHWINASEVAILGSFENNDHNPDTLFWIVDIKENFFRKYKYSGGGGL